MVLMTKYLRYSEPDHQTSNSQKKNSVLRYEGIEWWEDIKMRATETAIIYNICNNVFYNMCIEGLG